MKKGDSRRFTLKVGVKWGPKLQAQVDGGYACLAKMLVSRWECVFNLLPITPMRV